MAGVKATRQWLVSMDLLLFSDLHSEPLTVDSIPCWGCACACACAYVCVSDCLEGIWSWAKKHIPSFCCVYVCIILHVCVKESVSAIKYKIFVYLSKNKHKMKMFFLQLNTKVKVTRTGVGRANRDALQTFKARALRRSTVCLSVCLSLSLSVSLSVSVSVRLAFSSARSGHALNVVHRGAAE